MDNNELLIVIKDMFEKKTDELKDMFGKQTNDMADCTTVFETLQAFYQ